MTDDERRALVADLVLEVMSLEMPRPRDPQPSGVSGFYWKIATSRCTTTASRSRPR